MLRKRLACLVIGIGGLCACGGGDEFSVAPGGDAAAGGAIDGGAGESGASGQGGTAGNAGIAGGGGTAGMGGSGGKGGSGGGVTTDGSGGSSGGSDAGGTGGGAGVDGGQSGSSGVGGDGGSAGEGGTAGAGGASGVGGTAGAAGNAGAAGGLPIVCSDDSECTAAPPPTTPSWCAIPSCDTKTSTCIFVSRDGDGDGHRAGQCLSTDPSRPVVVGDDCDDGDKDMYPGNWDGPTGDGHPASRCDGKDQDCSGTSDDGVLTDGTRCVCVPGEIGQCLQNDTGEFFSCPEEVKGECRCGDWTCQAGGTWGPCVGFVSARPEQCTAALLDEDCDGDPSNGCDCIQNDVNDCSELEDGTPITWPVGVPKGLCQYGKKACGDGGKWGACIGAVAPADEVCAPNGLDEDCDNLNNNGCACTNGDTMPCGCTGSQQCADGGWGPCTGDTPQIDFCEDADEDGYCVTGSCESRCPADDPGHGWKQSTACTAGNDCADTSPGIHPGATETCGDPIDMNCDGNASDGFDPEGQSCPVSKGCCLAEGVFKCNDAHSATYCDGSPSAQPSLGYHVDKCTTGNQGYDWNCNGVVDFEKPTRKIYQPESECIGPIPINSSCTDLPWLQKQLDTICSGFTFCTGAWLPFQCGCKLSDVCGRDYPQFKCIYDTAQARCVFGGILVDTKYTMRCR